ncbi:MAG: D-sedoheptulose 7-phosphate isomerase [Candidatus Anstonellales archaeon]
MGDLDTLYLKRLRESIVVRQESNGLSDVVMEAGKRISERIKKGGRVFLFGNGGSASDAQHIAAEFVGRFTKNRHALPAMALVSNVPSLTAIANDFGYDNVFSRQLEGLAKKGDVVIGISTSGESQNVILGLEKAKEIGCFCIGLTGQRKGKMDTICDLCIHVPSTDTQRIQEMHIFIGHVICEIVEGDL